MKKVKLIVGLSFAFLGLFSLGLLTTTCIKDSTTTTQKMDKPGPPGDDGDYNTNGYTPPKSDM